MLGKAKIRMKMKGFTLVELIVTIAILAIIATLAAPSFLQTLRKNELNRDIRNFIFVLNDARSKAILQKKTPIVEVGGLTGWLPKDTLTWDDQYKPTTQVKFTFMGFLVSDQDVCYILKNKKDSSIMSVVTVQKNGTIALRKDLSSCA